MIRTTTAPSNFILLLLCTFVLAGCVTTPGREDVSGSTNPGQAAPATVNNAGAAPDSHRLQGSGPEPVETKSAPTTPAASETLRRRPLPAPPAAEIRYDDLWQRIRDGFGLPAVDNKYVRYYQDWYQDRPEFLARMMKRAGRYLYYIVEEVERRGIPMEIALLPAVESAFKPAAYSRAHASGLWQFIPATGRRYGLKQNWWYDGRRDVVAATHAALDYLQFLHAEFDGDWFHALAAYNAGERRIQRAILQNRKRRRPTDYEHLRLKSETRRYVPKLIAIRDIVASPERYGLSLERIPNRPYFAAVAVGSQLDLTVAGKLAGLPDEELRQLNPAFRRWATDPAGPHRILVPVARRQALETGLAALPDRERLRWARYPIKRGDTLGVIARRHGVSVRAIQVSNRLQGSNIRAGDHLIIPLSARAASDRGHADSDLRRGRQGHDPLVHHVRSGDTLWAIARRYDVYVNQLRRWNAIRTNQVLQLGQKILVYQN